MNDATSTGDAVSLIRILGAGGFGAVIGWYLYYTNRHRTGEVKLADLVTVVGVLGGGAIMALFPSGSSTDRG